MKAQLARHIYSFKETLAKEFRHFFSRPRPQRILFDHLPKCGGSSLIAYLQANFPDRKTFLTNGAAPLGSIEEFGALSQDQRYSFELVLGHLAHELIPLVHPETLRVTVFRDPVDRIISHYYYARRNPAHYLYAAIHDNDMSLAEYAASDLSVELRNWYVVHFTGLDATDAEADPEKAVREALQSIREHYDIIGFLNDFDQFADILKQRVGLVRNYPNQRKNVTPGRLAKEALDSPTLQCIQERNHLDIELYNRLKSDSIQG